MERPDLPRESKRRSARTSNKKTAQVGKLKASKPKAQKLILATPATDAPPTADLHARIAQRAYELYAERGYRQGCAMEDWLDAEREILSQIPPDLTPAGRRLRQEGRAARSVKGRLAQ